MTQAERYRTMLDKREGRTLDSSYKAAMFILSSEEALTSKALPYIDRDGIFFEDILNNAYLCETERLLLEAAHNLFRWNTTSPPSPHDIAMLGYRHLDVIVQAMYIAGGLHDVKVVRHENGLNLEIDTGKYEQAKELHEMLRNLVV